MFSLENDILNSENVAIDPVIRRPSTGSFFFPYFVVRQDQDFIITKIDLKEKRMIKINQFQTNSALTSAITIANVCAF